MIQAWGLQLRAMNYFIRVVPSKARPSKCTWPARVEKANSRQDQNERPFHPQKERKSERMDQEKNPESKEASASLLKLKM